MFGLPPHVLLLLFVCLAAACTFEFANGFHDTANAVATVIYTNALRPWVAVVWSAFWNFIGVFSGGIGEHAAEVRARMCQGLEFLGIELDAGRNAAHAGVISTAASRVAVRVIPTDEERLIAQQVSALLALNRT